MRNKAYWLYSKVAEVGKQHKMFPTSDPLLLPPVG